MKAKIRVICLNISVYPEKIKKKKKEMHESHGLVML